MQVTIPKGIVGGLVFTQVLQGDLREWHERPWTYVCGCLWKAKKKKIRSTANVLGTVC